MNRLGKHTWSDGEPRAVQQDGRILLHQCCTVCGRDFALGFNGIYIWDAVYVGPGRIERLPSNVTERWVSENCPLQKLTADDTDRGLIVVRALVRKGATVR